MKRRVATRPIGLPSRWAFGARPFVVLAATFAFVASGCAPGPPSRSESRPASATPASGATTTAATPRRPAPVAVGSQAACTPSFPDRDGWLGGDAAASVVLPRSDERSSLWLFGDSFVARAGGPNERTYPFVHNSIAISHCDADGRWRIDYAWRTASSTVPRAFFEPAPEADWVRRARSESGGDAYHWPISAARVGDEIAVALLRVVGAAESGPFLLPFRLVGVDLARLSRTGESTDAWRIDTATLSSRADVLPSSSLVVDGGFLHAFAFLARGDGRSPRILTRIPLGRLDAATGSLEDAIETWADEGRWIPGLVPARARILMDDDASEMSVHFDPGLGEWLAVYVALPGSDAERGAKRGPKTGSTLVSSSPVPTDALRLRRAPALTGPWSAPVPLFRPPELAARPDALPGELFCYAGKAHPELAPSGELLVTWVCNVYAETEREVPAVLERLRTTPSLYRPEARRIDVPPKAPERR